MTNGSALPATRQGVYGTFAERSRLVDHLLRTIEASRNWHQLSADKQHGIRMIVEKLTRILNGDPNHVDSWADIAGYAYCVIEALESAPLKFDDEVPL